MIFNSLDFALFLPVVFAIYWLFGRIFNSSAQNMVIVVSSYVFYGWWDWRFLTLIFFSSVVDYVIAMFMDKTERIARRKSLLITSMVINLGLLMFFKYFNFFIDNLNSAFTFFGSEIQVDTLKIILPVGISFYTFQTMSYTIDVYRKNLKASTDFFAFIAYVSFFPQLVAGPIERATNLLPQFENKLKRHFNYDSARQGLRQILWGLFKKMAIADNCAVFANEIFNNYDDLNGSTLIIGGLFFTFQIYGDFSGYSDIAIGTSKLFGYNLMRNFAFPYFSRDIAEFWRRWHISLSTWFRDYVYIPLGGSKAKPIRNTFIIFLLSGFWHGANWTFIFWGLINALFFLPLLLRGKNRKNLDIVGKNALYPGAKEIALILKTFALTVMAWIIFRAENMTQVIGFFSEIFSPSTLELPQIKNYIGALITLVMICALIFVEWIGRNGDYALDNLHLSLNRRMRWIIYSLIIFIISMYAATEETPFIYFQF
ncbi:MAG: MBOAT family protein [Crocinitomicaceae bacterium]|nr:MBOAT family protein [Crocinitomicaceae bacterium]MBK8925262.1 MBOAT family protein [Crocinitomicaceae bacterium]